MKISIIGTGYVGIVTAACFAELGHNVICVDIDQTKVDQINTGISPIYEEYLSEILKKRIGNNLFATKDYNFAIMNSDISFICVGTPSNQDSSQNIDIVKVAVKSVCVGIRRMTYIKNKSYHIIVIKSTVVPETTEKEIIPIIEKFSGKKSGDFGIVVNPEFLREGKAVYDFMHPDKIIVGSIDKKSGDIVASLYRDIKCEVTRTDLKTAEMIKYANNAFLATKISFANEIGNICKLLSIDTYDVMNAIGKDFRIGQYFLNSGVGFGGSCFPKDLRAIIYKSKRLGYQPHLLESVISINDSQPIRMVQLLKNKLGKLQDKKIAILGLAFKNDTDDIRESRSIPVIKELLDNGSIVFAYDPNHNANENMRQIFSNTEYKIEYKNTAKDVLQEADACMIMTEWDEFSLLDKEFDNMKNKLIIDGRHMIKPKKDMDYVGICW